MDSILAADSALFVFVNSTLSHPWLDVFFPAITDLHKTWFVAVIAGFLAWSFWRVHRRRGIALFAILLVTVGAADYTTSKIFKEHVPRLRPAHTAGLTVIERSPTAGERSFPSNHAVNVFAIATFCSAFLPGLAPWLFAIAGLVAYSRVYCGAHFPLDVIAGALWGTALGWAFAKASALAIRGRARRAA